MNIHQCQHCGELYVTRCAKCRDMAELGLTVAAPPAHWSDEYIGPDADADDAVHVEEVAEIHAALDAAADDMARYPTEQNINLCTPKNPRYTAQEVKDWPKAKAAMAARLLDPDYRNCNFVAIDEEWHEGLWSVDFPSRTDPDQVIANTARGLCMYRAQLDDPVAPIRRVNFTGHDVVADKLVAAQTYDHPANARARKVAQLRQEMDRPVPHPPEGRSERALASKNGAKS